MKLTLYDWGPSPFCLKVRFVLEHKKLAYRRQNVLGTSIYTVWKRGGIGKVPALDIDGELVCDSTDIAHRLEQLQPEPHILPQSARQRGLCHALEEWADEALYWLGIYFQWVDPRGKAMVPQAFGRGLLGRAAFAVYERRIRTQLRGQGTLRKDPAHVRSDLSRALEAAAALVHDRPFLLGAEPLLCDFAVASQLLYVSRTPVGGELMASLPALAPYLERMRALRS
ncbi:MAG: glutathione S-transferase family protein [Myxococcales bacterium]|nr:glutathione S-transferase family protein [Myxococcales bacterium]